jgi:hypothetical protein
MAEERANILAFVHLVAKEGVAASRLAGEKGAFWQVFDAEPERDAHEPELQRNRLGRDEAREYIGSRIQDGFEGFAGFCCLEHDGGNWLLRAEGFDTRGRISAAGITFVKQTLTGKFKPKDGRLILEDSLPSIPGVFTPKEGQGVS